MSKSINIRYAIARWPRNSTEDLTTWQEKIHSFCDGLNIFSREELLGGEALGVWGPTHDLALFRTFFC